MYIESLRERHISTQVADLILDGDDGVRMFVDGMTSIGLGHITKRFIRCLSGNELVEEGNDRTTTGKSHGKKKKHGGVSRGGKKPARAVITGVKRTSSTHHQPTSQRGKQPARKKRTRSNWESIETRNSGDDTSSASTSDDNSSAAAHSDSDHQPAGAPEAGVTNEAQAVRDSVNAHEVLKFIGRDCRALERGYSTLLRSLNPTTRSR